MKYEPFSFEEVMNFFSGKFNGFDCTFSLFENKGEEAVEIPGLLGFKGVSQNIWSKIDNLNKMGGGGIDFSAALSPRNTGEASQFFQIGRIDFIVKNPAVIGQIEFLSEMKGLAMFRQISLASFRLNGRSIYEITYDWNKAAGLHGLSLLECVKNPELFIKTRFV